MDIEHPQFETFQAQFEELAFLADVAKGTPALSTCKHYLCLYGENGLPAEEEFLLLKQMEQFIGEGLQKVEIETSYWQDTVLFVP